MASTAGNGKPQSDPAPAAAAAAGGTETGGAPAADGRPPDVENPASDTAVASVVARWRREDLLDKVALVLRGLGCVFSALAFVVMVSNSHGDWREFDKYEEYRYVVAISILALLYATAQVVRRALILTGRSDVLSRRWAAISDFAGDQIVAYLLISAVSAAIPITNRMREGADNIFTDASSASISLAFFAFTALALSALVSGFKLSNQTYI